MRPLSAAPFAAVAVASSLALSAEPPAGPRASTPQAASAPAAEELKKLIAGLSADDPKEREAATEELAKLGRAALPPLREAAGAAGVDAETKARLESAITRVSAAATKTVTDAGLELTVSTAPVWTLPAAGAGPTAVGLNFRIANAAKQDREADNSYRLIVRDAEGKPAKEIRHSARRLKMRRVKTLEPGRDWVHPLVVSLASKPGGAAELTWEDEGTTIVWAVAPGKWRIAVAYYPDTSGKPVTTGEFEIEIR
jgi:hypothetical protein